MKYLKLNLNIIAFFNTFLIIIKCLDLIKNNNSFKQLEFKVADDNAWDVGLACGGEIKIYIEKINS